ncbi:cupin domain-containing protein [Massilia sp. W12]|uniref:cupin domain-containing protein n=1 Tax=Massilia sp. W12 TaxID=3126507 RepID=UPI0030CBD381
MKPAHLLATMLTGLLAGTCLAQEKNAPKAPIERQILSRQMASGAGAREIVTASVSVAPGVRAGWHVHPGEEISQINEGEATLHIAGQPPRKLKAGDSFVIPAGVAHDAQNHGAGPLKVFAVYLVEPGKPLASPVSPPQE